MNKPITSLKPERQAEYALMQRIANGDTEAFEEFNRQYNILVFTTVYKVLNHHEDSQDVANEVLTTMWNKAANFSPDRGSLVTWICTTARNRAIDRLRAKQRQSKLRHAYTDEMDVNPRGFTGPTGPEAASRRDTCEAVRSAVLELTDVQREAIEKVYFEGLTQQEIADQLGQPLGTVKARIRRGLAALRKNIDPQ